MRRNLAGFWCLLSFIFFGLLILSCFRNIELQRQLNRFAEECMDRSDAPTPSASPWVR